MTYIKLAIVRNFILFEKPLSKFCEVALEIDETINADHRVAATGFVQNKNAEFWRIILYK